MEEKYIVGTVVGFIVIAILFPIGLVMLSDVSVIVDGVQVRPQESDATILILFTAILPILIVIGGVVKSMTSLEREESNSCIWFLRDSTCEMNFELNCKECKGFEK